MAYVGNPIDTQNTFQSLQGKRFSGDGSTTAFTLDVAPGNVLDIEVFVGNVRQDPNSAYTLSGTTLTFTGAPPSGTNNIYVVHQAKSVGTIDVPDDIISGKTLVTADSSADHVLIEDATDGGLKKALYPSGFSVSSITGATELAAQPAATDEIVLSDAGTLKRLDIKHIQNTPAFSAQINAADNFADASWVKAEFDSEFFDSDSAYDHSTNFRFTPAVAGKYMLIVSVMLTANADNEWDEGGVRIYKNGSAFHEFVHDCGGARPHSQSFTCHMIDTADDDDYYEVYIYTNDTSGNPTISGLSSSITRGLFTGIRIAGV